MPALKPATIGQKLLTDCGQNRPLTTPYIKKRGVDEALMELLDKAGFDIKFAIELIQSRRPYRKIRTLIERYYTTQSLHVIDELFVQFRIKKNRKCSTKKW